MGYLGEICGRWRSLSLLSRFSSALAVAFLAVCTLILAAVVIAAIYYNFFIVLIVIGAVSFIFTLLHGLGVLMEKVL